MFENMLLEFYDSAVDSIRSVDAVTPIIFAGKVFDDFGSGFKRTPGIKSKHINGNSNLILAFH